MDPAGKGFQEVQAQKERTGKVDWSLVRLEELAGLVSVLQHGCEKYGRDNWRIWKQEDTEAAAKMYFAAVLRHLGHWQAGRPEDEESGLHHLDHALASLYILRQLTREPHTKASRLPQRDKDAIRNDLDVLRKECPIPTAEVILRFRKMPKYLGRAGKFARGFIIEIDSQLDYTMALNVLIHEYAHCLAWDAKQDHGPTWGKAYSAAYQAIFGED